MSDPETPARPTAIMLQINTNGDPRCAAGFTKDIVASMFGWAFSPAEVLVLEHEGREILVIPWPDGMTLDEALHQWARTDCGVEDPLA